MANPTPYIFNALDKDLHHRKRKIIAPALADRLMRVFEPNMAEQIDMFLKQLLRSCSGPINMTDRCRRLTMDVAVRLSFGFPLALQTENEHDFILQGISLANYRINSYMNFPSLSKLQLDLIFNKIQTRQKWHNLVAKMIKARHSEGRNAKHDLYSFAMDNLEAESGNIKHAELFMESIFFISAGMYEPKDTITPGC